MPNLPRKALQALHLLEDGAIVILVLVMVALSCSSIVMRNLNMGGFTWADTAVRISVLWLAMFGALRASREQNHIAIDLVTHYAPLALQKVIHFIISITAAGICAVAAWYSVIFVRSEMTDGMTAFLNVPTWACEVIIPFTLSVMAMRFVIHSLQLPTPHEYTV